MKLTVYVRESTRRRDMISTKMMPREKMSVGRSNSCPLMISGLMYPCFRVSDLVATYQAGHCSVWPETTDISPTICHPPHLLRIPRSYSGKSEVRNLDPFVRCDEKILAFQITVDALRSGKLPARCPSARGIVEERETHLPSMQIRYCSGHIRRK